MRRVLALFLAAAVAVSVSAPALAAKGDGWGHRDGDRKGQHDRVDRDDRDDRGGQHGKHGGHERPFKWRDHQRTFNKHHMERIYDSDIERRHPGLHAYRWRGYGERRDWFWHNGHEVRDAILFFNDDDEVVSFGYMRGGVFIFVNEDGDEERDPIFFLRWFLR